jgi:hypothetical protein
MDRMRRRRFTPTASFTHGRGTNPNGSRQVRAQCNSAVVFEATGNQAPGTSAGRHGPIYAIIVICPPAEMVSSVS